MKKHRKGSVARQIQDWLPGAIEYMILHAYNDAWCWLPIESGELCAGLTWKEGYKPEEKEWYGRCMDGRYVINIALYKTSDFMVNGDYAWYAETYYFPEGADLIGGTSICESDIADCYDDIARTMEEQYKEAKACQRIGRWRDDI